MDNRLRDLVQSAVEKTERGGLTWKAFNDETFRVPIGTGYLHVRRDSTWDENEDGQRVRRTTYLVEVTDDLGRVAEDDEVVEGVSADFALADRLFRAARKAGLASDRVIDEMLQALKAG